MRTINDAMAKLSPEQGGQFLLQQTGPSRTFIPEDLDGEARLIGRTMRDFVNHEVLPLADRLEAQEPGLMRSLVKKAGALGLLTIHIPEPYGGLNLAKSVTALLAEEAAVHPGFALSIGVHSGVATLPLVLFGTQMQKERYLPPLAAGEKIAAFALSEANSGSDALAADSRAVLANDGQHYILNGTKFWITNAGFTDLFTVFAKVNGEHFTAFLVEREFPGVSIGPEEHKMGLKASSTCRLLLENAHVPVENVLGEVGKGGRVALYALNPGRFSIAASALGMGKENLRIATRYAMQRVQFGKPIIEYGLIQQKLAEMAVRLFALESMVYRVAGWWDARLHEVDASTAEGVLALQAAFEEYAIECAIIKVYGTETLDFIVDESLQIHGGYGYSEEFPAARAYRDARVYRIFEGTNEINRLTITDQLFRRLKSGRLDRAGFAAVGAEALKSAAAQSADSVWDNPNIGDMIIGIVCQIVSNLDMQAAGYGDQIASAELANLLIGCFALSSVHQRTARLQQSSTRTGVGWDAILLTSLLQRAALTATVSSYLVISKLQEYGGHALLNAAFAQLQGPASPSSVTTQIARSIQKHEGYPF